MQKRVKDAIRKIAKEKGLPVSTVEKMCVIPWEVTIKEMHNTKKILDTPFEKLPVLKHPHLGQFRFSKKKIENVIKKQENGEDRKQRR